MRNVLLLVVIINFIIFNPLSLNAKDLDNKNLESLTLKVSKKFSRTYCNTFKFGISNEGAIEFALGETNKEFSKNKSYGNINLNDLNKEIISNIENECQVYDFPENELARLDVKK